MLPHKKFRFDKPGGLMMTTLVLLRNSGIDLVFISKQTDLPFYWLRKFKEGGFKNPSVNRVQHLYEFLTGSKLMTSQKNNKGTPL